MLPTFPQAGPVPDALALAEMCRQAETAGAAGLWACDHLYWQGPTLDCMAALAVAASSTTRPMLGTCVLQLPLRRPDVVAKSAASLQVLSGGRLVLGLGVGTHPGEYEAAGVDFHRRGALLDAGITAMAEQWSPDPDGDPGTVSRYRQRPVPPPVPLWIGGSSPAARRRAARHDGWVPLFVPPDRYGTWLGEIRDTAERAGRDPAAVAAATVAFVALGADAAADGGRWMSSLYGIAPDAFAKHLVSGSARRVAGALARFTEAGANQVIVFVTDDDPLAAFAELAGAFASITGGAEVATQGANGQRPPGGDGVTAVHRAVR